MQNPTDKTAKILLATEQEIFDKLIEMDNPFRKLKEIINFDKLVEPLRKCYSEIGQNGIDVEKGFKAVLVQFWEDYSDREMEKCVRHNVAVRWFCGFHLTEDTPDHSYFGKLRKRIGTEKLADIFNTVNEELSRYGLFGNVFKFVDASAIVTKTALWEERDQAIADGAEKLNNANVGEYAADKDARWGAKGKKNIWFGYKRHEVVDMRYGLIDKVSVTPANVLDFQVMDEICPSNCMVFMDKLYDCRKVDKILEMNNCHAGTIRKRNNPRKNRDLDRWLSGLRMPFEGVFSKQRKRARYRGKVKVYFQCLAEAICHNLKKALKFRPMAIGA